MAKLTWQPGAGGRLGRWRKKYRKQTYYFSGGTGKRDSDARQAALQAFEALKARIDSEAPKRHAGAYEQAIEAWEAARAWATEHRDQAMIDVASDRVDTLLREFARSRPRPVPSDLTFEAFFTVEIRNPERAAAYRELGKLVSAHMAALLPVRESPQVASATSLIDPKRDFASNESFDGPSSLDIERAIWDDRIAVMQRDRIAVQAPTLRELAVQFDASKRISAGAGGVSAGRVAVLAAHVRTFVDFLGGEALATVVTGPRLLDYRNHLLQEISEKKLAAKTAKTRLGSATQFVRWLYVTEAIEQLPRIMGRGSQELSISAPTSDIQPCRISDLKALSAQASARTRLYLLLTLNTAMTQKDIADLARSEVDLKAGRITRKRSKTRKKANVPTVSYQLWPETLALLRAEMATEGELALTNARGEPLWREVLPDSGKLQKTDNIRSAFSRLAKKANVSVTFKSLKKLSASLLRGNTQYDGVCGLFLGHAPATIAERNYAAAPQDLLDEAVGWLGRTYREAGCWSEETPEN